MTEVMRGTFSGCHNPCKFIVERDYDSGLMNVRIVSANDESKIVDEERMPVYNVMAWLYVRSHS